MYEVFHYKLRAEWSDSEEAIREGILSQEPLLLVTKIIISLFVSKHLLLEEQF